MEPDRQLEIQLGHMCNNRCVFCVSGQRTELREAFPIAGDPVIDRMREARADGIRKVTLLGGEPTIQPDFLRILGAAVDLAFDEIVLFTNGAKTARAAFVDEILATGGNFTFRLSFQGATARAHERTTKKLGSFLRLVETMQHLRERGQRITVNMCVVRSNFESVEAFPALLLPYGVQQLHLDMVRPLDAGVRTEEELRAMIPRYSDLVPHLAAMVRGFPPGFDVNLGNLPYCVAPELAPHIHHDGEPTLTVSVDDRDDLSEPWDKYLTKRRDKVKPESCRECVFDASCSGVFDTYRRFYGTDELVPITRARLPLVDPEMRSFVLHVEPLIDWLRTFVPAAPFVPPEVSVDSREGQVTAAFARRDGGSLVIALRRPGGGAASTEQVSLHVLSASAIDAPALGLMREVLVQGGARVLHDVGADAAFHGPARSEHARWIDFRIGRCLERLRGRAPYGALAWERVAVTDDGRRAEVGLRHEDGTGVTLAFGVDGEGVRGGYRLDRAVTAPPTSLVEGVQAAMLALRGG